MSRHEADLPPGFVLFMEKQGYGTLYEFIQGMELEGVNLYDFLQRPQRSLCTYHTIAAAGGKSVDQLVKILEAGEFDAYLKMLMKKHGVSSRPQLEKKIGVGEGTIANLAKGRIPLASFEQWKRLSAPMRVNMQTMAEWFVS